MTDLSPLYGLRLRTPRLELRLGNREELVALGRLAEEGIHPPEEMPFAIAWSDRIGEPDFVDGFVAFHEDTLAAWRSESWTLNLLVWAQGELAGSQGVGAEAFAERRTVETGSWLGSRFQRRGLGTEMRAAVLELAFRGLGAEAAESGALSGNVASYRVSEKLGYELSGTHTVSPRGEPVESRDLRLTRPAWKPPLEVEIEGLEPCLPLFGLKFE
ncbi:MAG TPA: GNAT family protein [Gaiellaceae bacterium]|jgi:RimJ/RimL family protein N-acetyltransferase